MPVADPLYDIVSAAIDDRHLVIGWGDGHNSRFHPLWLRHQCSCSFCGTPVNAVRGIRLHHIPEDIAPVLDSRTADTVTLVWSDDGHRSVYDARWLRDHCYSDSERARRKHRPVLWDRRIGNDCPRADRIACETSPEARLALLETVRDYGFCFIENAPEKREDASRLIELFGPQRISHYGTYELSKKGKVDNVGDITEALDPHMDETYRMSTIGITVFQVLRPSSNGGHSTLVDGFEAVRRLREAWPEDFDLLTRLPVTGQRRDAAYNSGGQSKIYSATMPSIRVDFDGDVCGLRLNERQISPLDVPEAMVEPAYKALRRLYDIVYDPELRLTFELKAGEGLVFDNQRVLHGRSAFEPEEPARSVLTSSVDIEEFHSTLRQVTEAVRGRMPPMRLAQGMVA